MSELTAVELATQAIDLVKRLNEKLEEVSKTTFSILCNSCNVLMEGYESPNINMYNESESGKRSLTCPQCDHSVTLEVLRNDGNN